MAPPSAPAPRAFPAVSVRPEIVGHALSESAVLTDTELMSLLRSGSAPKRSDMVEGMLVAVALMQLAAVVNEAPGAGRTLVP